MSIDTDYDVLRKVLEREHPEGWAIEFGVYSGYSLGIIAAHMPVIGLDSFEGLPEDWREGFPKGTFSVVNPDADGLSLLPPDNAMIVPGLFENSVPVLQRWGIPPLGLVHIDCDLYSSTVTALEGIKDAVSDGTIIVFDEYHGYEGHDKHEAKAFNEWLESYNILVEDVASGEQERAFRLIDMGDLEVLRP